MSCINEDLLGYLEEVGCDVSEAIVRKASKLIVINLKYTKLQSLKRCPESREESPMSLTVCSLRSKHPARQR